MRVMTNTTRPPQHGFTLIEVMVALALASVVLLTAHSMFTVSSQAISSASTQTYLQIRATEIVDQIANDLKESGIASPNNVVQAAFNNDAFGSMVTNGLYTKISFRKCNG